jgi:hypothetical protein
MLGCVAKMNSKNVEKWTAAARINAAGIQGRRGNSITAQEFRERAYGDDTSTGACPFFYGFH